MSCSKKECCKQCRYVKFDGTMTKWPVQKLTHITTQKQVEHQDATDILKITHYFFAFRIFLKRQSAFKIVNVTLSRCPLKNLLFKR